MATLKIITNNVPRDILDASNLTITERKQFDYLDWKALEDGTDSASFFRYKGQLYDLGEFQRIEHNGPENPFKGWDGYQSDSFFSGTLVRLVDDNERLIVGFYVS